jgi:hypothetical protein
LILLLSSPSLLLAAPENPPPANKLGGYAGYELAAMQLEPDLAAKKNADKVLAAVEANMQKHVTPLIVEWNGRGESNASSKLLIQPRIVSLHKPSGANRFFAGAFSGQSRIIIKVRIEEQGTQKLLAEPEFYQHANALAGAWTVGATDNLMLERVTKLIATYLKDNYEAAVGGKTGYE